MKFIKTILLAFWRSYETLSCSLAILLACSGVFAQDPSYLATYCKPRVDWVDGYVIVCQADGSTGFIRHYKNSLADGHEYQYFSRAEGGGVFRDILWDKDKVLQVEEFFPGGGTYYLLTLGPGEPLLQFAYKNWESLAQEIISLSLRSYGGNCPCPYNRDAGGKYCGGRSAYSRPGGYSPLCYTEDIESSDIQAHRQMIIDLWYHK